MIGDNTAAATAAGGALLANGDGIQRLFRFAGIPLLIPDDDGYYVAQICR